jgi:hypothetical protein
MDSYKIMRFRREGGSTVVQTGLTLEQAQAHCQREDTHGDGWFDGYDLESPTAEQQAERAEGDRRMRRMVDAARELGV